MTPLVRPALGLLMLIILVLSNACSIVRVLHGNASTIIQNFGAPMRRIGFARTIAMVTIVAALIIWLATDTLFDRFYSIVAFFGAIFAACVGVLLVDGLVLRRSRVDLLGLHDTAGGPYAFWGGINPVALSALFAGFATYLTLLDPLSQTPSAAFRYASASLPAFAAAFLGHLILSRLITIPAGPGGYHARSRDPVPQAEQLA
jgi:NCS1 family nucleobase:cation symporter-1